jgi:hypothetical protein
MIIRGTQEDGCKSSQHNLPEIDKYYPIPFASSFIGYFVGKEDLVVHRSSMLASRRDANSGGTFVGQNPLNWM